MRQERDLLAGRRSLPVVSCGRYLTAFLAGVFLALLFFTPIRSDALVILPPVPAQYKDYNVALLRLFNADVFGFETLRRLWLGQKPSTRDLVIFAAMEQYKDIIFATPPTPLSIHSVAQPAAAISGSYTFASATPAMPFFGNQSVVLGATLFANDSNLAAVGFRRTGDCTLVESILEPVNNVLTDDSFLELPNAQDYLHSLAGLTTTPDGYPNGCDAPSTGRSSVFTTALVGVTPNGIRMVADLNASTSYLEVQETNGQTGVHSTLTLGNSAAFSFLSTDVNGDGNDDLIVSGVPNPVTTGQSFAVYLNNGDGTFQAAKYFDAAAARFLVADINGDGKADLVGAVFAGGVVSLLGNGDGTFQAALPSLTTVTGNGSALVSGDFDGDGKPDLLLGNVVLKGAGDGTFTTGPALSAATANELGFSYSAVVGDVNNDGKLDIVYTLSTTNVAQILLGHGDGTFSTGARYASLPPGQQITLTDIDGDGNLDLAVGNNDKGMFAQDSNDGLAPMQQFLLGRGDGTFAGAPVYVDGTSTGSPTGATLTSLPTAPGADFNGDGKLDVLTFGSDATTPSAVAVLPGDGTGVLGTPILSAVQVTPTAIASADFSGDGKVDVVVIGAALNNATPRLALLKGQGDGHFAAEQDYALSNIPNGLAIGDFNGDGHPDVAVGVQPFTGATGDSGVYILFGKADGTLAAPVKIDASVAPSSLIAADLNGDGRADLIVIDQGHFAPGHGAPLQVNGALHVYVGNADGTFTAGAVLSTSATNYSVARVGDLNGDGKADLIVAGNIAGSALGSGTAAVYTLLGNGDGTFKAAVATPLFGNDGIGAGSMTLADFNGDGKLDVAVGNTQDFTEVLFGAGDGSLVGSILALGQQSAAVGSVDLNGDGMPDLLVQTSGGLAVFMNVPKVKWAAPSSGGGAAVTTTALSVSPNPATMGQAVTLSAAVTSGTAGNASGTITFFDGSASLGTGTLAQGAATLNTSTLGAGTHTLTAQYGGDTSFGASTSAAVTFTVSPAAVPDFAIAASPAAGTVTAGQEGSATLTLTPSGGFNGVVTLACSGLPSGATCSFAPGSVTLSGIASLSTLSIATTARTAMVVTPDGPQTLLAGLALPAMIVGPLTPRSRRRRTNKRAARLAGWAGVICVCGLLVAACGGDRAAPDSATASPGSSSGTAVGTYTITVTASSNGMSHSAAYVLTVN